MLSVEPGNIDGLKRNCELTETRVIQVSKAKTVSVTAPMMLIRYITSKHTV